MHGPEYCIGTNDSYKEMYKPQIFIHHSPIEQFGEPVINTCKHPKDGRNAHHYMKMCHDEVGIMQLNINSCIPQKNTS